MAQPLSRSDRDEHDREAAPTEWRDPEPFSVEAQGQSLSFYPAGKDRLNALVELIDGALKHSVGRPVL